MAAAGSGDAAALDWIRPHVDTRLGGIYEQDFEIPDSSRWKDGRAGGMIFKPMWLPGPQGQDYGGRVPESQQVVEMCEAQPDYEARRPRREFRVHNARPMQEAHLAGGGSLASFFEQHGFVLVTYPTAVTDWSDGEQIASVYQGEVEDIARNILLPGRGISRIDHVPAVLQRGADVPLGPGANPGNNPMYAGDAHQDLGRTPRAYIDNFLGHVGTDREPSWVTQPQWKSFAREFQECLTTDADSGVEGFMQINLWRTMRMADHPAPLTHLPLAILDGATIDVEDLVPTGLAGFSATGMPSSELAIRHNPRQRWCYYPALTNDEIVVLKQFQWIKALGDDQPCAPTSVNSAGPPSDARVWVQTAALCTWLSRTTPRHRAISAAAIASTGSKSRWGQRLCRGPTRTSRRAAASSEGVGNEPCIVLGYMYPSHDTIAWATLPSFSAQVGPWRPCAKSRVEPVLPLSLRIEP